MKCVGCQRRGTACIGQQFSPEGVTPPAARDSDNEITQRLDRFERLLGRMMQSRDDKIADRSSESQSDQGDGDQSRLSRRATPYHLGPYSKVRPTLSSGWFAPL